MIAARRRVPGAEGVRAGAGERNGPMLKSRIALIVSMLLGAVGCVSPGVTPPPPLAANEGRIEGFELPPGCTTVQLRITVTQGTLAVPGNAGTVVEGMAIVEAGRARMPDVSNVNLAQPMKIRVEVIGVVGTCDPLVKAAAWEFEGTLTPQGEGRYSVPFARFTKV